MVNSPLFEERYNTMRGYKTPASKEEIDSVKDTMKYNIQNVDGNAPMTREVQLARESLRNLGMDVDFMVD